MVSEEKNGVLEVTQKWEAWVSKTNTYSISRNMEVRTVSCSERRKVLFWRSSLSVAHTLSFSCQKPLSDYLNYWDWPNSCLFNIPRRLQSRQAGRQVGRTLGSEGYKWPCWAAQPVSKPARWYQETACCSLILHKLGAPGWFVFVCDALINVCLFTLPQSPWLQTESTKRAKGSQGIYVHYHFRDLVQCLVHRKH